MEREEGQLGYVKYSGELVKDGYLDARKSAQALLGVDEAVRFFIFQQAPELRTVDFEFPVKVKKGSWEIVIGGILLAYGVKAAQKMAVSAKGVVVNFFRDRLFAPHKDKE